MINKRMNISRTRGHEQVGDNHGMNNEIHSGDCIVSGGQGAEGRGNGINTNHGMIEEEYV